MPIGSRPIMKAVRLNLYPNTRGGGFGANWQQKAYEFSDSLKASLETEDALASEDSGIETARPSENTKDIEVSDNQKDSAASDAANNTDTAASEPGNQAGSVGNTGRVEKRQ